MKKISLILLVSVLLANCNAKKKETKKENESPKTEQIVESALKTDLEKRKSDFAEKTSDYKKKIYAEGIQSVKDNKIVENALQVGDTAIDFTLTNAANQQVSLYDELKKGPVILMWYRGGWCPYCNITLRHMQENLPAFKKYNANLLALTPEILDNSISTKEKNNLEFEVLSDINSKVAKQYNLIFKLTDEVATAYEESFTLSSYNGNNKAELPLAATYVIGTDKVIKYAFLDADYRNRAEPEAILNALKQL